MPENIKIIHILPSGTRQYNMHGWVAHQNDLCVGHIHMLIESEKKIKFLDAWVHEEYRRQEASRLLHEYINENLSGENVIVMGDFNDELTDIADYNVFNIFLADVDNYLFADFEIAIGNNENWSYPLYGNDGSHIDHILITNELFNNISNVETLLMGSSLSGGFGEYNYFISDHRPMILSLDIGE